MLTITRRDFSGKGVRASVALATTGLLASPKEAGVKFRVGVTDWNLGQQGKVESIALAKKLGFDGVQVSTGKGTDKLPLSDLLLQNAFLDEMKRVGLKVESLCLDILHRNYLKSDPSVSAGYRFDSHREGDGRAGGAAFLFRQGRSDKCCRNG
jgi:L-ribulose-5-phosphate 3-epimerase